MPSITCIVVYKYSELDNKAKKFVQSYFPASLYNSRLKIDTEHFYENAPRKKDWVEQVDNQGFIFDEEGNYIG